MFFSNDLIKKPLIKTKTKVKLVFHLKFHLDDSVLLTVYQISNETNLSTTDRTFFFETITEQQILTSIDPAYIYKGCADVLCEHRQLVFKYCSREECVFPERLKKGIITPVFKAGQVDCVE